MELEGQWSQNEVRVMTWRSVYGPELHCKDLGSSQNLWSRVDIGAIRKAMRSEHFPSGGSEWTKVGSIILAEFFGAKLKDQCVTTRAQGKYEMKVLSGAEVLYGNWRSGGTFRAVFRFSYEA